jgi:hypothetical protein
VRGGLDFVSKVLTPLNATLLVRSTLLFLMQSFGLGTLPSLSAFSSALRMTAPSASVNPTGTASSMPVEQHSAPGGIPSFAPSPAVGPPFISANERSKTSTAQVLHQNEGKCLHSS